MNETATADLSSRDRRALRAQAHALKPVVWIAQSGATPGVLQEIDRALTAHELVKMHAAVDGRATREAMLTTICAQLGAQPVQVIGKMLVAFRARPVAANDPPARAPKSESRARAARSTPPRGSSPRKRIATSRRRSS